MADDKNLHGRVIPAVSADSGLTRDMFTLMDRYFFVDREEFFQDLSRKDWIILLEDEKRVLRGFTSLALIETKFAGKPVQALYSGDTIIDRECWGSLELPRVWGKFMLDAIRKAENIPLYWFLLSSGYRTYRFLPVFFRDYFPRHDRETPPEVTDLLHHLGGLQFGPGYDSQTGCVTLPNPTPLREGVAEVPTGRKLDPTIAYFLQRNPGHEKGVELACLAPLTVDNLRPFIRRTLGI